MTILTFENSNCLNSNFDINRKILQPSHDLVEQQCGKVGPGRENGFRESCHHHCLEQRPFSTLKLKQSAYTLITPLPLPVCPRWSIQKLHYQIWIRLPVCSSVHGGFISCFRNLEPYLRYRYVFNKKKHFCVFVKINKPLLEFEINMSSICTCGIHGKDILRYGEKKIALEGKMHFSCLIQLQ